MRLCRSVLLALLCLTVVAPARAQRTAEAEIRAVLDSLFAGMRTGDSTAVRAVMHPEARLLTTSVRTGQPLLRSESIDDFVRAVGTPHDRIWDERIDGVEFRIDPPIATAWMNYRFYAGEQFSHCGVNAIQLFRGPSGWKIVQIMDTRRQSCAPA